MAGQISRVWKHHCPGQITHLPPQFGIDEIAQASQCQTDGYQRDGGIGKIDKGILVFATKEQPGDDHTQGAAMKTHSPFPYGKDLQGIAQVIQEVVKHHIAQTSTEDHPQHHVKDR
ncbi:hypothetical protein DSECCO2_633050 [anaerobic digester metagenome]